MLGMCSMKMTKPSQSTEPESTWALWRQWMEGPHPLSSGSSPAGSCQTASPAGADPDSRSSQDTLPVPAGKGSFCLSHSCQAGTTKYPGLGLNSRC